MSKKMGACGCGEIRYTVHSDIISVINCHCEMCRAHNGTAFTSYVIVPAESLDVTDESGYLSKYKKDQATKNFCSHCGTPIFNAHDSYQDIYLVYLGTFGDSTILKPVVNTWCENQLDWISNISHIKSIKHGS